MQPFHSHSVSTTFRISEPRHFFFADSELSLSVNVLSEGSELIWLFGDWWQASSQRFVKPQKLFILIRSYYSKPYGEKSEKQAVMSTGNLLCDEVGNRWSDGAVTRHSCVTAGWPTGPVRRTSWRQWAGSQCRKYANKVSLRTWRVPVLK